MEVGSLALVHRRALALAVGDFTCAVAGWFWCAWRECWRRRGLRWAFQHGCFADYRFRRRGRESWVVGQLRVVPLRRQKPLGIASRAQIVVDQLHVGGKSAVIALRESNIGLQLAGNLTLSFPDRPAPSVPRRIRDGRRDRAAVRIELHRGGQMVKRILPLFGRARGQPLQLGQIEMR